MYNLFASKLYRFYQNMGSKHDLSM
uniref:Uncharacterized protein n=1 Tax=Arundo donax TaxID=35708 RepID=A0A0A8XZM6_ARUDO